MATNSTNSAWRDDPVLEQQLEEMNLKWEVESLDPGDIDEAASLRNQVRITAKEEELILQYAEDMTRGDIFPRLLGWRPRARGKGKLMLIDGNQRFQAAKVIDRNGLEAYVLKNATEEAIAALSASMNTRHGLRANREEQEMHAVHLIGRGLTHAEVARRTGLPQKSLANLMQLHRANERAEALELVGWNKLAMTIQMRLGPLREDSVFRAMFELVRDFQLPIREVDRVLNIVRVNRSERPALDAIKQARAEMGNAPKISGKGPNRIPSRLFSLAMYGILAQPVDKVVDTITEEHVAFYVEHIKRVQDHLAAVLEGLNA